MQEYRPLLMAVTFGFLGIAFYLTYRPRPSLAASVDGGNEAASAQVRSRSRIMAMNKIMLWTVTAIAVAFLFFPQVITSYVSGGDRFTADMQRTVINIEGMT